MEKLPNNYKKMLADIQTAFKGTDVFIDNMMFAKGDDFYGYVPKQKNEILSRAKWPDDKRTALTKECYEKACEIAERYGLTLLLAHFILAEGSTMLMGTAEVIKEYLEKIKQKEDKNA